MLSLRFRLVTRSGQALDKCRAIRSCSPGTVREGLSLVSPASDQYADTVDKSAARIVVGAVYYATFAHCACARLSISLVKCLLPVNPSFESNRSECATARHPTPDIPL